MIKLTGDWYRFPSYLRGYSRKLSVVAKVIIRLEAEKLLKMYKDYMVSQPTGLPPLTEKWIERKEAMGYSKNMWMMTKFFYDNLKIVQVSKGVVFVGATRKKHKPSGLSMSDVAKMFEYGTKNQPPRPIFGPVNKKYATVRAIFLAKTIGMQLGWIG